MRDLTMEQFKKAPPLVKLIYMSAYEGTPVSGTDYETAIWKYSEYFPEEEKIRKAWKIIPQHVVREFEIDIAAEMESLGLPFTGKDIVRLLSLNYEDFELEVSSNRYFYNYESIYKKIWDIHFSEYFPVINNY